jgi:hypothetical protein
MAYQCHSTLLTPYRADDRFDGDGELNVDARRAWIHAWQGWGLDAMACCAQSARDTVPCKAAVPCAVDEDEAM